MNHLGNEVHLRLILLLVVSLNASAQQTLTPADRADRARRLEPMRRQGLLNESDYEATLHLGAPAMQNLLRMGRAMGRRMRELGFEHLSQMRDDPSALAAVRRAGREALRSGLNLTAEQAEEYLRKMTDGECILNHDLSPPPPVSILPSVAPGTGAAA